MNTINNCPLTLNTTRICANNAIDSAIEVSRIVFTTIRPNAVILVNKNEPFDAIAASSLIHHPINASFLYTDGNRLSKETLKEIKRLSPKGYKGIHVIVVGNISKNVVLELESYGFKTHYISGVNQYETACKIPDFKKEFHNLIIMSGEDYTEGIMASYWSTHHGDPILYVQKNNISNCTLNTIAKMHDINVYIIGSLKTVSKAVENTLSQLPNVKTIDRIDGENPYEISVNFSKYYDKSTEFGWNKTLKDGHAFTFGTLNNSTLTISGALFAHMGKHTPLLLIEKNMIPNTVEHYIKSIKPTPPKDMPRPPFMHGFILGDESFVPYETQVKLEDNLSIDKDMKM